MPLSSYLSYSVLQYRSFTDCFTSVMKACFTMLGNRYKWQGGFFLPDLEEVVHDNSVLSLCNCVHHFKHCNTHFETCMLIKNEVTVDKWLCLGNTAFILSSKWQKWQQYKILLNTIDLISNIENISERKIPCALVRIIRHFLGAEIGCTYKLWALFNTAFPLF